MDSILFYFWIYKRNKWKRKRNCIEICWNNIWKQRWIYIIVATAFYRLNKNENQPSKKFQLANIIPLVEYRETAHCFIREIGIGECEELERMLAEYINPFDAIDDVEKENKRKN